MSKALSIDTTKEPSIEQSKYLVKTAKNIQDETNHYPDEEAMEETCNEVLVCSECGDEYVIKKVFACNSNYFEAPYHYDTGCDKYCLSCWLGVGPKDV